MIKVNKLPKPTELTPDVVLKLTTEYKTTKKSVWKKAYIEEALLSSSHSKCAYCECKLNVESKYMEVEHYQDKHTHPDLVVDWDNLLPSCKRCNGRKHKHNTEINPIIDPSKMNPQEHLKMKYYRLIGKTDIGKETISVLLLNDTRKVVQKRFEISQLVHEKIEELLEKCQDYHTGSKSTRLRNRIVQTTKNILEEASPQAEYAATVASDILNDPHFHKIIDILKSEYLWDSELDELFIATQDIALL
ncbi:HNH endonuclease [Paenibacillus dokdonensis]|uniref:HNH endonuclease n=1 Tax=Paenibacillus dokdonensis TaxID=2567944 RepID=UPI0010A8EBA8|nr:HNH endonuclease [Paenibacillus dokdonensis]